MENNALITGAASGIGYELAKIFLVKNYRVVLVDVNETQLYIVKEEFEKIFQKEVPVICCDLSQPGAAEAVFNKTNEMKIQINTLVNNAGFGIIGHFKDTDWDRHENLLQLTVINSTRLVKLYLENMVSNDSGKILNVASMTGLVPGPLMSTYYAAKSYLISFTLALANELGNTNIKVTVLCPGLTKTNFSKGTGNGKPIYGTFSGSPEFVARHGFNALEKGKTIAIPYFYNKLIYTILKFVPKKRAAKIIRLMLQKKLEY